MSTAIVIGGAGFVGAHLLQALVDAGEHADIACIDIASPRQTLAGVRYFSWDMRKPFDPSRIEGPVGDIYNLAAVHVTPGHSDIEYFGTNISCAIETCRLASAVRAEHLTFVSSIAIYGAAEQAVDEDSEPNPTDAYGLSKLQAEWIHRLWQEERPQSRRLTIVRPGVVYGPREAGNFTRLARQLERRLFVYPGRSDTIKACGYVKELIDAILFMKRRNGDVSVFNFCHDGAPTLAEICDALCAVGGLPRPRTTMPKSLMMTAALGMEVLSSMGLRNDINRARMRKLFTSTHVLPRRLREAGYGSRPTLAASLADWHEASGRRRFE